MKKKEAINFFRNIIAGAMGGLVVIIMTKISGDDIWSVVFIFISVFLAFIVTERSSFWD